MSRSRACAIFQRSRDSVVGEGVGCLASPDGASARLFKHGPLRTLWSNVKRAEAILCVTDVCPRCVVDGNVALVEPCPTNSIETDGGSSVGFLVVVLEEVRQGGCVIGGLLTVRSFGSYRRECLWCLPVGDGVDG